MQKMTFNRYEKKFILTTDQKDMLLKEVSKRLTFDENIKNGKPYQIYNLYYDTNDYEFIRHSLSKPIYKDKVRLRAYHYPLTDEDLVFLEIKKKFEGRVNKRRIIMSYKEFKAYLNEEKSPEADDYLNLQVFQEIEYLLKRNALQPKAYIAYERIALHNEDDSLRVTFDHNIRYRNENINFENDDSKQILEDQDEWLMEIKSIQNFPLWLVNILSENKIYATSFSKYGKAYKQFINGGTHEPNKPFTCD